MKKILITGAMGQIGSELIKALRQRYGHNNVVATDCRSPLPEHKDMWTPFELVDITKRETLVEAIKKHQIDTIYHMAAILSAVGEQNPQLAWNVNINGLYNVLEAAREYKVHQIFCPSSIAAFGPSTPKDHTPQDTILQPSTMYGLTKVTGELLCDYYCNRFGLDVRGVRFPGIISSETLPGGGTTDFAVAIYYDAVRYKRYTCFVREDTILPMMYMPDAIKAAIDVMEADRAKLVHHSNFNLSAMSFSAGELAGEIKKYIPEFVCTYQPDFRQKIADSWPKSIDDSAARHEWNWQPSYDISAMTQDMLEKLTARHHAGKL